MFGFQTIACLRDIPVIRSSTNKLQDVYVKAKNKSLLIQLPCNLVEMVADKSLKIASMVANPFVKSLHGSVRVIDDFTVEKIRQIEAKYPVINMPTKDVINTLNEKTEPVRHMMNSVKDTTTSTIQHGKEAVSNVATATVNKATNVADTVYTFCETHVPGKTVSVHRHDFGRRTTILWNRLKSNISFNTDYVIQLIQYLLIWYRILILSFLLKIKQTNDGVLHKIQQKQFLSGLLQRILILTGNIIEYIIERIQSNDKKENNEQSQLTQQKQQQFVSRQTLKPGAFVTTRQTIRVKKQDVVITHHGNEKPRLDTKEEEFNFHSTANNCHQSKPSLIESVLNDDIGKLHDQLKPTDIELLYSRLPADIISSMEDQEYLTEDQQMIHAKFN
ncbi:unnamed protein product [Rotaria sordida]|uniref:Uncharacterized protein n=1 Tax=Rotaria sordida TaxID=392033 RepID=A0A814GY14_9BILA|nr:unnamed protein product [Rotaria sordida]